MIRLIFLYPISVVVRIIILIRNKLYDWNILRATHSKLPVISIGNIQVGGTGKTPFVASLIKLLYQNNIQPVIITRGYKRITNQQIILNDSNQYSVEETGDEPYYLKKLFTEVSIIIDHNKNRAVHTANTMQNIDCIILDDGYQSRYIKRDIDIVLINTWVNPLHFFVMPSGYLREKISNLNRADFIYTTKGEKAKKLFTQYNTHHLNSSYQLSTYNNEKYKLVDSITKKDSQKIIAFSGIANPNHFKDSLSKINIEYDQIINLKNHYQYSLETHPIIDDENIIYITTYKDFFKLSLRKSMVYILDMQINIDDNLLLKKIIQKIHEAK